MRTGLLPFITDLSEWLEENFPDAGVCLDPPKEGTEAIRIKAKYAIKQLKELREMVQTHWEIE
jgi:hypothetical protein